MTVELLPPELAVPSNPRWHELRRQGITASEIAACLGLSPWESAFSLYWRKAENLENAVNDEMRAGARAEVVIADWWAEQHPEFEVTRAGLYAHPARPWEMATPDRLVSQRAVCGPCDAGVPMACTCGRQAVVGLVECKYLVDSWDGWGEPGTDDIPVYYRCQVMQQIDVMGVEWCYLAAWHGADFREYFIQRDEKDIRAIRAAGVDMMRRLKDGDPPPLDGSVATLRTLRQLHPDLDDREQEISWATAEGYRRSRAMLARAKQQADLWEARLRVEMGDARKAVHDGGFIASRSIYDRAEHVVKASIVDRINPARTKKGA